MRIEEVKMKVETYFLRYAFPCSHILCKVREEVSAEEFKMLEKATLEEEAISRELLERVFFRAFERIKEIANERGKDKWDIDVIREYFRVRHEKVVNESDYPESFKEMCRVNIGEVSKVGEKEVTVTYGDKNEKKRIVKKDFLPDLKIGDTVTIHWQYAVEKVI